MGAYFPIHGKATIVAFLMPFLMTNNSNHPNTKQIPYLFLTHLWQS